jgi:hypothetical protein
LRRVQPGARLTLRLGDLTRRHLVGDFGAAFGGADRTRQG